MWESKFQNQAENRRCYMSCLGFRKWYKSCHTLLQSLQSSTQDVRKIYLAVLICSIHFGESTLFGTLQHLWRVFPVKAGQKLQGRKLVGIDNMKNKLESIKWKQDRIYSASCVDTTSDIRRSLHSVPEPGHSFAPKCWFGQVKKSTFQ